MKIKHGKIVLWITMLAVMAARVLQYLLVIDPNGFFLRETLPQQILSDLVYWVMALAAVIAFSFGLNKQNKRSVPIKPFCTWYLSVISVMAGLSLFLYGLVALLYRQWLGWFALGAALYFLLLPLRLHTKVRGIVSFLAVFALAYPCASAIDAFFTNFREINASENVVDAVARCAMILMVLSLTKLFLDFDDKGAQIGRNFFLFALFGALSGPVKLFGLIYTKRLTFLQGVAVASDILLWIMAICLYHLCVKAMKEDGGKKMKQLIYAHRGASFDYPENTMLAFRKAVEQGADGIELDVQFTKDHKIVVCHDDKIDRTSNGSGYVEDYTFEELLAFDFGSYKGEAFAGEKIPLLSQVLDLIKESGILLNIEIKNRGEKVDGLEEAVSNLVNEYELGDKVIYSSFDHQMLYRLKAYDPTAKTAALYSYSPYNAFEYMKGLDVYAIHPSHKCLHGQDMCKKALEAGWQVNVWTVDTVEVAAPLVEAGVTSLITNRPAFLREELTK
ncbi:MAG: glycerophosphodiester phosphodiesterase [Clostridia bacterium]|nr:glycerophosphodiester phosphodiesterase [Clostridia bacterium]